ncbi:uncharacterized protein LOC128604045 [Ictalurus furcatus]|uniref:uncharacterized protein LOC128604045 n=1 Tax=Ictalurus furcatus TaxID=66913 RepID=UPI002350666E|nr:uncharacterized protein LOC128604045 [Ictalurus furcatus]
MATTLEKSTDSSTTVGQVLTLEISFITAEPFSNDLLNTTSPAYTERAKRITDEFEPVFKNKYMNFINLRVIGFRPGSIISDISVTLNGSLPDISSINETMLSANTSFEITSLSVNEVSYKPPTTTITQTSTTAATTEMTTEVPASTDSTTVATLETATSTATLLTTESTLQTSTDVTSETGSTTAITLINYSYHTADINSWYIRTTINFSFRINHSHHTGNINSCYIRTTINFSVNLGQSSQTSV